ncbi:MAG: TonB-dependent receptor [Phenylobacterium sp.]|uniref:TonB-dependent receptor domain-containing protein n=1 Tax=Phenylobacterium sp. TaxID=1871053 RepID=UPI00272810A5|nr:TonB-dependent receptor [Phenylobacterium sp.]MDO8409697.1 TonB-dependent receptor [Phenylobacterium sp.]
MLKRTYFCGGSVMAVALAMGAAGQAAAQSQPTVVEEIVVTGSFIAGTPENAALPVDVIGTQELERRGTPSMVQLIKTIPSSGAVIGENNRFGAGNGAATINLRNLNSTVTGPRTLVLFNGRRVASTTRALGSVDVNMLPSSAITRVEVLKDGAAATYGSDAIAGVVNFITRTNLDGLELTGQYQFIDGSDGDYELGAAWGWQGERANLLLTGDYRERSELSIFERDWAILTGPEGYLENPLGGWAGTGNPGQYNYATTAPVGSPNTGFTAASFTGALPDIGCAANGGAPYVIGSAIVSPTACNFQYSSFDNLVENEQQYKIYGQLDFDVTDDIQFRAEALYANNSTPLQSWAMTGPNQSPSPILASGGSAGGGVSPIPATGTSEQSRFYIPAANPGLQALISQVQAASCSGPVLPYGIDAASCATGLALARAGIASAGQNGLVTSATSWRPIGFAGNPYTDDGHSHYTYETQTFRVVGGFNGRINDWLRFDSSLTYQQIDYEYNLQDVSVNRLQLGLRGFGSRAGGDECTAAETNNFTTNAGNAALGCYFFNPFANAIEESTAGTGANPYYIASSSIPGFNQAAEARADVVNWMEEEQYNHDQSRLLVADLIFSGETPWTLWADDNIAWAAGAQYRYDRDIRDPDAFYDANATPCVDSPPFGDGQPACPTTANGPFLFNANIRPYDVNRKITSAFAEVRLPILDNLEVTLAGRYEKYEGVGETFNPKANFRWQAMDWFALRGAIGTTYRAPQATIVTDTFARGLTNASGTYRANDLFGNPNIEPEEAMTYSVGAIFDFDRFNATIDYWNFDFDNPMTSEATADLLNLFFPGGAATGLCANPEYDALEARFTFVPGSCARTDILGYRTQYINGGAIKTSGVDFNANIEVAEIYDGQLTVGFDGTYLLKYEEDPYEIEGFATSTGTVDRAGTYRASIFTGYNKLRANAFVNYNMGIHNVRWQLRHVSSTTHSEATPNAIARNVGKPEAAKIGEYWQHDITYRVELPWETSMSVTVQNLFDEEPPFAIGTQYNYDFGSGNPLGRVIAVSAKKRF